MREEGSQKVQYDTKSHWNVLTQMHGSVWLNVLPHCLLNSLIACIVIYLDRKHGIDVTYSDRGHTFMSMIVSFLIVTRSNIAYARFMEARTHLGTVMKSCRELMQYSVTFTRYHKGKQFVDGEEKDGNGNLSDVAKWRFSVARKTIVLLRSVVSVLEFETTGEHVWKNKILNQKEKKAVTDAVGEDNFRTPMVLAMFLRTTVASNVDYLEDPLHVNKEIRLYAFISDFTAGYHGLTKLIDTQFPFPLLQMTRTCVFVWVYTLPTVLYNDMIEIWFFIVVVFFITYAFIGLECVSTELDDPFGNDPNDFDVLGLARVVFQDIYICIYDVDGEESAKRLKQFFEIKANRREAMHTRRLSVARNVWLTGNHRSGYSFDDDDVFGGIHEPGDKHSNLLNHADMSIQDGIESFNKNSENNSATSSLKGLTIDTADDFRKSINDDANNTSTSSKNSWSSLRSSAVGTIDEDIGEDSALISTASFSGSIHRNTGTDIIDYAASRSIAYGATSSDFDDDNIESNFSEIFSATAPPQAQLPPAERNRNQSRNRRKDMHPLLHP